ncbi:M23 family metallopeptidase [Microbacterium esteraromaticum]|uniref:peptidoglycan DD-metalloendopeptidase family protein n=1 Tax=Microbacterium esteraromaticum TaxID=57043 RepID=UPI001A8DC8CD|nr:M23 family metallopeptidase [Microbacterium esteraromaticum]
MSTQNPTRTTARKRRAGQKLLTIGAMMVSASFAVGMTIPSSVADRRDVDAHGRPGDTHSAEASAVPDDQIQAFVVPKDTRPEELDRATEYAVTSAADLAAVAGIRHFTGGILTDPNARVQWPFPVSVPTSSNFGPRWGRQHEGADFTPGEGAEIQAIADGVVRIATEQGGAFGVTAYIEHVVDGRTVLSRYAHMQFGSLAVRAGERVAAGQRIGLVGNTGRSFGAHLHLEIATDEGKVDPVAWLGEKTGNPAVLSGG